MRIYRVEVSRTAEKQLGRLPRRIRSASLTPCWHWQEIPGPQGCANCPESKMDTASGLGSTASFTKSTIATFGCSCSTAKCPSSIKAQRGHSKGEWQIRLPSHRLGCKYGCVHRGEARGRGRHGLRNRPRVPKSDTRCISKREFPLTRRCTPWKTIV